MRFSVIHSIGKNGLLALGLLVAFAALPARAQSTESMALSLMPLASIVVQEGSGAITASAQASGAVMALPLALSVSGSKLVIKSVEVSANGTVYVLERVSDGARTSVRLAGKAASAAMHAAGTLVHCSLIGAGAVLTVADQVFAFVPNETGRALLHNERL